MFSVFASHAVGHGFATRQVIPKTIIQMVQNANLLGTQAIELCKRPVFVCNCQWGQPETESSSRINC